VNRGNHDSLGCLGYHDYHGDPDYHDDPGCREQDTTNRHDLNDPVLPYDAE
jgi:hypothetical protein